MMFIVTAFYQVYNNSIIVQTNHGKKVFTRHSQRKSLQSSPRRPHQDIPQNLKSLKAHPLIHPHLHPQENHPRNPTRS